MRIHYSLFVLLICSSLLLAAPTQYFVSTSGDDTNPGTAEKPFATLQAARDAIRAAKPSGGAVVQIRGGLYSIPRTLEFTAADSGSESAPICYRAAAGEKVVLIGGLPIKNFKPYHGLLFQAELADQGFKGIYFRQLFFDGKRQQLARRPNFDPANPYGGGWAYADGKVVPMYAEVKGENKRTFQFKPGDMGSKKWVRPQEAEVFVFPRFNWWNNIVRIDSIDRETSTIKLAADCSYPIRPGDRYYIRNIMEELDSPGEWYLGRITSILYFWPPAPLEGKTVCAPTTRTILSVTGASHLSFENLTIECCEGTAVTFKDSHHCRIVGCTIRNAGDYNGSGVSIVDGTNNLVSGCDISEIGSNGILISGGDPKTLTPANNVADNNYIHHFGVYFKQGVGIALRGVGNRASHNLIHDGPRMGIMFGGNNLVMEYNHIRHVNLETADTGAIYTGGRDWIGSRGSIIRHNYLHDILGYGCENGEWVSPHYSWGVYLDDNTGGVDVVGNIVVGCLRGLVHLHNGRDNLIENNILVDGKLQQLEFNGWTDTHRYWKTHLPTMIAGYESVMNEPAWKKMRNMHIHPNSAVLPNKLIMTDNVVRRNIFYWRDPKSKLYKFRNVPLDRLESDYNLFWNGTSSVSLTAVAGIPEDQQWIQWRSRGFEKNSLIADPLFVNAEGGDYRLKSNSPACKLGFKPIPVEKIGPYASPNRASWPIVEAEGAREKPLITAH